MATEPVAPEARQAIENREAALLTVVEALVQGVGGVGQFLQRRTGIGHGCGALTQALDRIVAGRRVAHRTHTVEPQLAVVARRLLEGRPVLLLVRRQGEPGLERSQPRLAERAHVIAVELLTLLAVETAAAAVETASAVKAAALLRVDQRGAGDGERCRSYDNGFPHDLPLQVATVACSRSPTEPTIKLKFG